MVYVVLPSYLLLEIESKDNNVMGKQCFYMHSGE